MKKYLVTGGCGFIGSHLVKKLLKNGSEVVVLDDLSSGRRDRISNAVTFIEGSITDTQIVQHALSNVDGVFHLAAIASVAESITHWEKSSHVNYLGSITVFEALAKQINKIPIVFASSAAVYGNPTVLPINEQSPTTPLSPYGADKLGTELQAKLLWQMHQIPSVGLRLFNVYGPNQAADSPYSGVISIFIKNLQEKRPLAILGKGEQQRDFISVHDVTDAFIAAMEHNLLGAKIYNVCTGQGTSINRLAKILETFIDTPLILEHKPMRAAEIERSIGDPMTWINVYGKKTFIPLEEGLKQLYSIKAS